MFFCPLCKNIINNFNSACCVKNDEGLPILIKNFEYLENDLAILREKKHEWYQSTHLNYLSGPFRHHIAKRISYLKDTFKSLNLPKNPILLDIGCGDGFNLTWLKEFTQNLYGTDYNFLRALRAKKLEIGNIALADINSYPVHDNSFDVVFFNHVLEHISDDEGALSEVFRILKKDGICILGIPNEGAIFWKLAYKIEPKIKETTDHLHFYTLKSASQLSKKVGFQIMSTKRIGYGIPYWSYDAVIRQNKFVHDFLDIVGRLFFPTQATSLYLILKK